MLHFYVLLTDRDGEEHQVGFGTKEAAYAYYDGLLREGYSPNRVRLLFY